MVDFLKRNKRALWLVGIDLVLVAIFYVLFVNIRGETAPTPVNPVYPVAKIGPATTSTPTANVSNQQAIDQTLSLTPPSAPNPGLASISEYEGCRLSLGFTTTGGNAGTSSIMDYTLAAKNIGSIPCLSASISVYYANNEVFAYSSPKATAKGYYWQFGTLAPGQEDDVFLTTNRSAPLADGDVTNEACLSADNGADACANASPIVGSVVENIPAPTANSAPQSSGVTQEMSSSVPTTLAPQPGKELGIWVWTALNQMSTSTMENVVNEAAANNFNAIYVTVDEYIAISNVSNVTVRQADLQQYQQDVTAFLALASAKNISVDAEAGSPDWSETANQWEPEKIMAFVAAYNESHTIKFRGVQYDIESYLLPAYANDEAGVLTNYVEMTDALAAQAESDDLPLTMVIPHFYDDAIKWTPEITVDGVTTYTDNHLLRILGGIQHGRLIVMAYRNFATGSDGSISLANEEVTEADDTSVKVIVAQETGPVNPSYVTFYGLPLSELASQVSTINQAFDQDVSFQGIAIDYLQPFLDLH